jgi:hypothetical protein
VAAALVAAVSGGAWLIGPSLELHAERSDEVGAAR